MSLTHFITWMRGRQDENDRFTRAVGFLVKVYIVFACVWTIGFLVGEILQKIGVA